MASNSYSRTTRLRRRLIRIAGLFMLLATMQKAMPVVAAPAYWSVKIARPSINCQRGLGVCIDLFGPIGTAGTEVAFVVEGTPQSGPGTATGRMVFLSELTEKGDTFEIEQDVVLDRQHSLELGYKQVTLLRGRYPIDRSAGDHGSVLIGLRTIGITITADIGRRAYGCERFGVCSITVGFDLAMNKPAPGTGTLEGSSLSFDFTQRVESSEDSSVIYVDEDIALDEQSSLALGARSVTILKGAYRVDYSENPNGHVDFAVARIGITVTIDIGRKSLGCTRAGICSITVGFDFARINQAPAVVSLDGKAMLVDFLGRPHSGREPFVLEQDYVIERDLATKLGRQQLTLQAGTYELDFSVNPNGRLVIPVSSQGIVVTVEIGRASKGCRGLGICSITIGADATERSVPAVLSVSNGMMSLDLLGEAPETGDALTIDEDLTLDAATSRLLRYNDITLKRGVYAIDRSSNPFGSLVIPIAARGISIEIHFGRTSECIRGFGVCRIIIALSTRTSPSDAVGYAAAETAGSTMTIAFSERSALSGDTLFVDEDVPFDPTTGAPLGAERLLIKRGAYPVDYSSNPAGTVTVVTQVEGSASVDASGSSNDASDLMLWPNPATTTATTRFSLATPQSVRLELLDAMGTVVLSAIDGERLERGSHERTLDLAGLTAGAYFERLTVGTTSTVRALQIVR